MRTFSYLLKLIARCLLASGVGLSFVYGLDGTVSLIFNLGGDFIHLLEWCGLFAFCCTALILWHNVDTYPERERAARFDEQFEKEVERKLRAR